MLVSERLALTLRPPPPTTFFCTNFSGTWCIKPAAGLVNGHRARLLQLTAKVMLKAARCSVLLPVLNGRCAW